MFIQTKQRKLRLLSNNSSMTSSVEFQSKFDNIFSAEAEQRINDWLDAENIIQKTPEEHFRDFFQQSKDTVYCQVNLLIHQNSSSSQNFSSSSLSEIEFPQSSSSCSSCISSPASLDLKRSPILTRRRINIGDLLTNKKESITIDTVQGLLN